MALPYRLVSDKNLLPKDVKQEIGQRFSGELNAIMKGKQVVGFIVFNLSEGGKKCFVEFYRSAKGTPAIQFRKQFGVFPGRYLLEHFIRTGVETFGFKYLKSSGQKTMLYFCKKKLLSQKVLQQAKVTPLFKKTALARKRRI